MSRRRRQWERREGLETNQEEDLLSVEEEMEDLSEESSEPEMAEEELAPIPEPVVVKEPEPVQPKPEPAQPKPAVKKSVQFFTLEELCPRIVKNWKPHWLPGIQAYVKALGFGERLPEAQCKALCRRYGFELKK